MMSAPNSMTGAHPQPIPSLNLFPLNDSFIPKHISLANNMRVKIGRQTNAKTVPGERNGYFDSKVLSRQHAEVWEEGGKIYIKDVKSSNGTFINGERLSQEGLESEPFELKTDDIVEYGIDIVGEDNKTIIHHKVAARVTCILTPEDATNASREHFAFAQHQAQQQQAQAQQHPGQGQLGQMQQGQQRRPSVHAPPHSHLGAMAPTRVPGKSGLTFDHILSRLQAELHKSRETGAELHQLTGAMTDIHDTLGGAMPPPAPPYPHALPPVRPPPDPATQPPPPPASPVAPPPDTAAITALQSQLHETQSSLTTHLDKMRNLGLEGLLSEHETIKREVTGLRELLDEKRRRELDAARATEQVDRELEPVSEEFDDDDDARSVSTVTGDRGELDEDRGPSDEEEEEGEEERRRRREELGRPRTPEPTRMGMVDSDEEDLGMRGMGMRRSGMDTVRVPSGLRHGITFSDDEEGRDNANVHDPEMLPRSGSTSSSATSPTKPRPDSEADRHNLSILSRLEQLSTQLESALALSQSLQAQQTAAQSTIAILEAKVEKLEKMEEVVRSPSPSLPSPPSSSGEPGELVTTELPTSSLVPLALGEWKKSLEGQWEREREEWEKERERLRDARSEWERRISGLEADMKEVKEATASSSTSPEDPDEHEVHAPPSPRSLSSDSVRAARRRRTSAAPGRGRSRSPPSLVTNGHANGNGLQLKRSSSPLGSPIRRDMDKDDEDHDSALHGQASSSSSTSSHMSSSFANSLLEHASVTSSSSAGEVTRSHHSVSAPFLSTPSSRSTSPDRWRSSDQSRRPAEQQWRGRGQSHPASADQQRQSPPSSTFLLHPTRQWLIIIFAFTFLLPQPVPMVSAASIGFVVLGIAAFMAINRQPLQ